MSEEQGEGKHLPRRFQRAVSEAERERVIGILKDAFARGLLEMEDFETRLETAHDATDLVELNGVAVDLPAVVERPSMPPMEMEKGVAKVSCVMATRTLSGRRLARPRVRSRTIMGETHLDYRQVGVDSGTLRLDLKVIMGSVRITVPRSMAVEVDATPIMGEVRERGSEHAIAGGPVLQVRGKIIMGELEVRTV